MIPGVGGTQTLPRAMRAWRARSTSSSPGAGSTRARRAAAGLVARVVPRARLDATALGARAAAGGARSARSSQAVRRCARAGARRSLEAARRRLSADSRSR